MTVVKTPFFVEKLRSGDGIKMTGREDSLTFVASFSFNLIGAFMMTPRP
jgi:hypothetical protein